MHARREGGKRHRARDRCPCLTDASIAGGCMIVLSKNLSFDATEYASRANAILGIRDSGKTYTATLIAEQLYDNAIPFFVFDPIGRWRFMRMPGAGHGYPIVVAGGAQPDLPLTPENAPDL